MGKLYDTRAYLCGAMSYDSDAKMWRNSITFKLQALGVKVFDPCAKPIDIAEEDSGEQRRLIRKGYYPAVKHDMEIIRAVDIRMVTLSDFMIVDVDIEKYTVGSWEEVTKANDQVKPIIARIKQGKENTPPWLLAMIPHEMIFSTWDAVDMYLGLVDAGQAPDHGRWIFFNQEN